MKIKDIYHYAGTLYAANLIASGVTFLVMVFITRAVSKEAMGAYGLFQAYFLILASFTGFGLSQCIVKYVAERRTDVREIHTLLGWSLAGVTALFWAVGAMLIARGDRVLGLAMLGVPAYQVIDFALSYARGHLWKKVESGLMFGSSIATSIFIVIFLQWFPDYRGPVYGQVASMYASAFVTLALFFWHRKPSGVFAAIKGNWTVAFFRLAGPIFIASSLYSLASVADRFIIKHYLGLEMLGEYFVAMSFLGVADKPVGLLSRVLLSHFAGTQSEKGKMDVDSLSRITKINLLVLPLFALGIVSLLPVVLEHFLNKDYGASFNVLAIASIIIVVKAVEVVNSQLVIANDSPITNAYSHLASLAIYIPVAIALANFIGILGLAMSVVLRWISFATWQFIHMKRRKVVTVSGWLLMRGLIAYSVAIAFFVVSPYVIVPVYLAMGVVMKLWSLRDLARIPPMMRATLVRGK